VALIFNIKTCATTGLKFWREVTDKRTTTVFLTGTSITSSYRKIDSQVQYLLEHMLVVDWKSTFLDRTKSA